MSVIIPLILSTQFDPPLPFADQVIIALLTTLLIHVMSITLIVSRILSEKHQRTEVLIRRGEFTNKLQLMQLGYEKLLANALSENDLFLRYFEEAVEDFTNKIEKAGGHRELDVNEDHFSTTEILMQSFRGKDGDECRFVAHVEDIDFMTDVWSQAHNRSLVQLVDQGRILSVRRLFIYESSDQLLHPEIQDLLRFHKTQAGFDCRTLRRIEFSRFMKDNRISCPDFGIYGTMYLYKTRYADVDNIEGTLIGSEKVVKNYSLAFDRCWDLSDTYGSDLDKGGESARVISWRRNSQ